MSKKYIHYGAKRFDPRKFHAIQNAHCFTKPVGGFWASPVDAKYGWKEWCYENNFRECNQKNSFTFTLSENAKVLTISSVSEAKRLPQQHSDPALPWWVMPDFEALLKQGYDAVEVEMSEDWGLYQCLYGWDCDSMVILNPEVITNV